MSTTFVALDIETTGLTLDHAIIELGLAVKVGEEFHTFGTLVRPEHNLMVDTRAMAINGVDLNEVFAEDTPPTYAAERRALSWLHDIFDGPSDDRIIIPVGFNVGSFDIGFLKEFMPVLAGAFSYRCLELNSAFLTASECDTELAWSRKRFMAEQLNRIRGMFSLPDRTPHRAESDALDALLMQQLIAEGAL